MNTEQDLCPICETPCTYEALAQWGMCHDCDNQLCPDCGQLDCEHEEESELN